MSLSRLAPFGIAKRHFAICLTPPNSAAADANIEAALAAYECERLSFGSKIVAHARHLGAHLETHDKPGQALYERETGPRPDIVLREYGAPHLLRDPIPANVRAGATEG